MTSGEREQRGPDEAPGVGGAQGAEGANVPGEPGGAPSQDAGDAAGAAPGSPAGGAPGAPRAAEASGPRRGTDADLTGRLLGGRYRVTDRIGRGGMGVVCRAVDEVLGREVAVKVLRAYTDASAPELADLRTRMQREARAAARIRHSGVITVHDVIDEDGRPVIVMELVDGPSLDDALAERGPLDPREIARIGAQVMDALDAAHQVGVLHRDVKPGNVLLDRTGRVVLTDFGIASIEAPGDGASTNITRSGELVGSLDYLPPERAQGQGPTPASDIWSLGMTLYAAVEGGGAPFRRTSVWSTLTAIVTEALPEPRRAGPLTPVLHALMAKNPADRPSAAEARSMLRAVAEGRDPAPAPAPGAPHLPTATDLRPLTPPAPPQELPPPPRPQGQGPQNPPSQAPGPAQAHHPHTPPPAAAQQPGFSYATPGVAFDPPGVTAGPSVGSTGTHPYPANSGERETERLPARRRRRVALAVAAVLAVLATGGGVTYALVGGGPSDAVADRGRQSPDPASTPGEPGAPSTATGKDDAKGKDKGKAQDAGADGGAGASASGRPSDGPTSKGKDSKPGGTGGSSGDDGSGAADGGHDGSGGGSGAGGTHGGASGGGGSGDPTPAPTSCVSAGGGKTNCDVWRTANSYTASFQQVGTLNMGTNYFHCQAKLGRRETYGKWTNVWWAKTDDDSGNTGVYISVVYLKGGANDQPVPGLPVC
ncbi:serine/threonine-protein kinase [Streptomyces endophytica]|uniref:serine/threonine-protein kinase n=1 Tax=Streptomyces endophytica TaxID=2991496 RepID=UPI00311B1EF9